MMEKVKCELCGKDIEKPEKMWGVFGHLFCDECAEKFKDYIQITVDIAEQERKAQKRVVMDDVSEFSKIKEGKKDIVRTSREYQVGEVVEICYDGFAYKDTVKCKVVGCHKSASDGYIIELINL